MLWEDGAGVVTDSVDDITHDRVIRTAATQNAGK